VNSLDFDRRTVMLLAAVFLAAVGLTLVFTRKSQPAVPVAAPTVVTSPSAMPASRSPSASPSPAGEIVVEVVGKVRDPQVVTLPEGARVLDAVEAAGGVRPGVDTTDQNLARVLVDGEQIRIGLPAPAPAARSTGSPGGTASPATGGVIDINTATAEVLEQIPGVGPVLAQRIIAYREQNGGFQTVEQLMEVSGIGEATFAQMQSMVTVGAGG
jgi:competence protein ComEA